MISLTREYRFFWPLKSKTLTSANSWGGACADLQLAPFVKIRGTVRGNADQETGYLLNIQVLDRALARLVEDVFLKRDPLETSYLDLAPLVGQLSDWLPKGLELVQVEIVPSPHCLIRVLLEQPMSALITQEFEFSAAHRLHAESMTPDENRTFFGKCNNPAGHGHNYVVAVTVLVPLETTSSTPFSMRQFEARVKRCVIDRLDHKHLNHDVPEFRELNPSVENIATVIWDMLANDLEAGTLHNIRVYETPKTWADYSRN